MIVEDNADEGQALKELFEKDYAVAGLARTYEEALELFYKSKPDVVIIDVFLDGKPEGISFAETINTVPISSRPFVFLTNSKDRKIFERARLTNPYSFLIKPCNELEIQYAIEMAVEKFCKLTSMFAAVGRNTVVSRDYLFIKKKDTLKKVHVNDMLYLEVEERYCSVFTEKEKFLVQMSLTKMLELLDPNRFCQTHRNYIVNTERITEIIPADNLVVLTGNHRVTLSDKYKSMLNRFSILK
jgi:two-component system LytT family response regulator